MKKSILSTILVLCLACSFVVNAQVTSFLAGRFQNTLDSVCAKYKIKGITTAVLIPGVGIWKGAYGESSSGQPVNTDMLMGMGSNTKTHISATLLKMQEQHLVSMDDTIGKWIQGYPNISGQITIRQCLSHTSGLFDYMQNDVINDSIFGNPSKHWTREEILGLALAPNFVPGSSWDYSNTNYIIAGIIIEKVLNKSPYAAVHDMVLAPAQLQHTFNYGDEGGIEKAHPWSLTLSSDGNMIDMTETPYLDGLFTLANTAGSLITTAEDNVQFWHKLWNKEIINEQSWKEMTATTSIGGKDGYGLGIFFYSRKMNGRSIYCHGGTFFGYINENMVDTTSGVTIAALTNQDSMNNNGLLNTVVRALHKVTLNMPATGIEETMLTKEQVSVYPNPASDRVKVSINGRSFSGTVMLTDMMGSELHKESFIGNRAEVFIGSFPAGIYFLTLTDDAGNRFTSKVHIVQE
jgi:D-alanyl-D-alanine carboxypeptidase